MTLREAQREDTALILQFIKELADYENMSDDVVADEALLEKWIFDKQKAEVIYVMEKEKEYGLKAARRAPQFSKR